MTRMLLIGEFSGYREVCGSAYTFWLISHSIRGGRNYSSGSRMHRSVQPICFVNLRYENEIRVDKLIGVRTIKGTS